MELFIYGRKFQHVTVFLFSPFRWFFLQVFGRLVYSLSRKCITAKPSIFFWAWNRLRLTNWLNVQILGDSQCEGQVRCRQASSRSAISFFRSWLRCGGWLRSLYSFCLSFLASICYAGSGCVCARHVETLLDHLHSSAYHGAYQWLVCFFRTPHLSFLFFWIIRVTDTNNERFKPLNKPYNIHSESAFI